ncbi:ABC transporter substrate-binding protein [Ornithinibacillus bavariensis]|uniref:ABC transporter substrate-binding protein n=1 Tax=Ornithinibacillus bavariensis TaxID=545502 RepID=A0A919X918_9BACI|nr:ABC transporter substrate-binding protein [Ornithinibacillus bavariensis]GIO28069.1 ABC transporter substrate-binding protein [Ornithinibacillus bavariensis]
MNKKTIFRLTFITLLIFILAALVACTSNIREAEMDMNVQKQLKQDTKEKSERTQKKPKAGGTLVGGMYTSPTGMFNPLFYEEANEENILAFTHESLVSRNEHLEFVPKLAEKWEINEAHTELTLFLKKGVKWHDGEKFTANDVVFTYESISHPDYIQAGGILTSYAEPLLDYIPFSNGETQKFEGVVAKDDYTVIFKFSKPTINPIHFASAPIIPKHIFEDIPVAEMPKAPESLEAGKVIGTGPFRLTEMVENEQYVLEGHKDYWQGTPYLNKIIWRVVPPSVIVDQLENGEIDFIANPDGIPLESINNVHELENITIIEQPSFSYQLLGFKHNYRTKEDIELGIFDPDNWKSNKKLSSTKVRQAIAFAINREAILEEVLYNHGAIINAPIAKPFWAYDENATKNYAFNPKKASTILDELGYLDNNDDGFREDPDDNEWVLNFNYPIGNELHEKSASLIKKMLGDIGINVHLRPQKMAAFMEDLSNDKNELDLYLLGWNLGSVDPDPTEMWGATATYNFSRWNNPKSDELLKKAVKAPEAYEQDYRKKVYKDWQELFSEDLPVLLLYAQNSVWAYNNRLQGVEPLPLTMYNNPHLWWVTVGK